MFEKASELLENILNLKKMEYDCLCWNKTTVSRVTAVWFMKCGNSSTILTSVQAFVLKVIQQMSMAGAQILIFLFIKILTLIWVIYCSNLKESCTLLIPKLFFQAVTGQLLFRKGFYLYHTIATIACLSNYSHHMFPSKINKFANTKEVPQKLAVGLVRKKYWTL